MPVRHLSAVSQSIRIPGKGRNEHKLGTSNDNVAHAHTITAHQWNQAPRKLAFDWNGLAGRAQWELTNRKTNYASILFDIEHINAKTEKKSQSLTQINMKEPRKLRSHESNSILGWLNWAYENELSASLSATFFPC